MFAYSLREKTHAHRSLKDDVPEDVKKDRLKRMIDTFLKAQLDITKEEIGRYHLVLVDSKGKYENQLKGKTDTYRSVIFENDPNTKRIKTKNDFRNLHNIGETESVDKGDYVIGKVKEVSNNTLFMDPICKVDFQTFCVPLKLFFRFSWFSSLKL